MGYSFRLAARVLLYAPSHRQDSTYHGLCYTSRGALAGTRNSSMGPPHEGSIRRPIAPYILLITLFVYINQGAFSQQVIFKNNCLILKNENTDHKMCIFFSFVIWGWVLTFLIYGHVNIQCLHLVCLWLS